MVPQNKQRNSKLASTITGQKGETSKESANDKMEAAAAKAEGEKIVLDTTKKPMGKAGSRKKRINLRRKRESVKLATRMMKTNYEKSLMNAMLHITSQKQGKVKEKGIVMDFELSPSLKLPHQLYQKNLEDQEIQHSIPNFSIQCTENNIQKTAFLPVTEAQGQQRNHITKLFPPSIHPSSANHPHDPAPIYQISPSSPSVKIGNLEPSSEILQMHALKSWT